MGKTLSLSRRTHLFVKDEEFCIKLQKPNYRNPVAPDFYILKHLTMNDLQRVRDWADEQLKNHKQEL